MKGSAQAVPDSRIRQRALQPDQSFLIQAPAGSGKTELLIQRYLRLLAVVKNPEEILAITFTRKAGAEMRGRIISALDSARAGAAPKEAHLQIGYGLAMAAIERDRELDWQLRRQPTRLRIGTIDAVNSRLSRRAPLQATTPDADSPQLRAQRGLAGCGSDSGLRAMGREAPID